MKPATLLEGLAFAEAPRWHQGELWFSDFYTLEVARVDAHGTKHVVVTVPGRPSGLGWLPDGRLLVVSMLDRQLLRLDPQGLVVHADLSALAAHDCNDMVVDARGNAYVGNFGFDFSARAPLQPTVLIHVPPQGGQARAVADDLYFPNGSVITPDGRTLVVAETMGERLTAFDMAADGSLGQRRVWAPLPGLVPDGICQDADGAIWAAMPRTREFVRVREGGEITDRIACDDQAIACVLGGATGHTLYLLSGHVGSQERALSARSARIATTTVAVPGWR